MNLQFQAQGESLKAARQYQSAISVYRAAKETVTLAEERLLQNGEGNLSAAWQEMMNHATMRVNKQQKIISFAFHEAMTLTSKLKNSSTACFVKVYGNDHYLNYE